MADVYIDLRNKKIINSNDSKYIKCDEKIAEVVMLLNGKGYITNYSCSGHIDKLLYYEEEIPISEEKFLKNNKDLEIIKRENDKIIYRGSTWLGSNIYISFEKDYNFIKLPKGYFIENEGNYTIRKLIPTQDENGDKYTLEEMKKIQINSIVELFEWAKKLKSITKKER